MEMPLPRGENGGAPAGGKPSPVRIIRPSDPAGGPLAGTLDLNLEDLRGLAERMVREGRERLATLEAQARALEESSRRRAAELEGEMARRREEAERELAAWIEAERSRARAAERSGFEEGRARGDEEGRKAGRDEGFRAGFEEGYSEGRQAGFREAQEAERSRIAAETSGLAESLASLVRGISDRRRALLGEAKRDLLPLAMEIARKVIKREVRESSEAVIRNVRKAIDLSFRRSALVVEVHPEDQSAMERWVPQALAAFAGLGDLTVRAREDVGRGGCRVVSGTGMVDLSIESQLELIEQSLFGALESEDLAAAGVEDSVEAAEVAPRAERLLEREAAT